LLKTLKDKKTPDQKKFSFNKNQKEITTKRKTYTSRLIKVPSELSIEMKINNNKKIVLGISSFSLIQIKYKNPNEEIITRY
jgi:hypothetical protein